MFLRRISLNHVIKLVIVTAVLALPVAALVAIMIGRADFRAFVASIVVTILALGNVY
jgi:hypothetical protein